jgi:hypothetical protein
MHFKTIAARLKVVFPSTMCLLILHILLLLKDAAYAPVVAETTQWYQANG